MIPIKYRPKIRQEKEGRVSRNFEEPTDILKETFKEYYEKAKTGDYDHSKPFYQLAEEALTDLKPREDKVNSLLNFYEEGKSPIESLAGYFLTAAYNKSDERNLVYRTGTDLELRFIGRKLNSGKSLILESDTASAGGYSEGTVINLATVKENFSFNNRGLAINLSQIEDDFALMNRKVAINLGYIFKPPTTGIFLNFGEFYLAPDDFDPYSIFITKKEIDKSIQLNQEGNPNVFTSKDVEQDPDLRKYLEEIEQGLQGTRDQMTEFLRRIGPNPADRIEESILNLVGDSD